MDELRTNIIKHASELFFQFGPSKVTMEEIAERLGMSKKTLYKAFASKDELLSAVVAGHQEEIDAMMQPLMEAALSADELSFTAILAGMSECMVTKIGATAHSPLFPDLQRSYPLIWKELEERRRVKITTLFQQILDNGSERGIFRPELHHQFFIVLYVSAVNAMMNPVMLSTLDMTANDAYRMMVMIFFNGALTDKGRTIAETFIAALNAVNEDKNIGNSKNNAWQNAISAAKGHANGHANGYTNGNGSRLHDDSHDSHFAHHGLVELV
jgi:AcrR family transcriptional regulator